MSNAHAAVRRCHRILVAVLAGTAVYGGALAYGLSGDAAEVAAAAPGAANAILTLPAEPLPVVLPAPKPAEALAAAAGPARPVAESEKICLAEAVYYEARGESADGQRAVAEVVARRSTDPRYPNSICGVVYQDAHRRHGCQFSFACDGKKRSARRDPAAWNEAVYIAGDELTGPGRLVDTSKGATHFHTLKVRPSWSRRFVRTVQIGNHIFYRQPGRGYEARDLRNAAAS